ncbi:MAG: hypothetical protein ACHQM6_03500 [Candidatus Kapaibacterium sp.]
MGIRSFFFGIVIVILAGCSHAIDALPPLSDKFSDIQQQTFNRSCNGPSCHDAITQKSLLCLAPDSSYNQLMHHVVQQNGKAFSKLVIPGNPDSSFLVYKLTKATGDVLYGALMPNNNTGQIPQNQIDAIISWIRRGAPND